MGVGTHVDIEGYGITGLVAVVAPVAVLKGWEQALLGARVQRLATHDQPGPGRPVAEVDQAGELTDLGPGSQLAVLAHGGDPTVLVVNDSRDRPVDAGV